MSEREIGVFETKRHRSEIVERILRRERGGAKNPAYCMAAAFDEPLDDRAESS